MAPGALTARALNRATLARQGLLEPIRRAPPSDAVRQVGSLQAQHPEWPPVALASRVADARTADLAGALDRREVVRSSLMRTTIHVVASDDLWPMFAVCQPMRLNQWKLVVKADPIDSPLGRRYRAAHEVALEALREEPRSSGDLDRLMAARVKGAVARAAWRHLAAFVPLVHVPHVEEGYGRSRYAIAEAWLGEAPPDIDPHDARVHVARRYLGAFGPSSVEDLAAYVGGGVGGITPWRRAIEALGDELVSLRDEGGRTLHDLHDAPRPSPDALAPPRLLARWDSLLLSHATKHRQRFIADRHRTAIYTRNADVRPALLVDGFVSGTWELGRRDGEVAIEVRPLVRLDAADRKAVEAEAHRLLRLVAADADGRVVRIGR